ncbi:hypothetical protein FHS55_002148 [Angulomicrobium tetraedrale]|uniref:GcrA cell cycle regulator n=1 Tax=Ancylobacter tetraedralis TaxID=217068 RepID=A0A839Z9Y9_9HYPH|nr:GcrA family cell cycle regulator [Ancylobacter tetraedralis]MBB3771549.1 hypothetical protein [Ancylobacter tetraedralis]
MRGASFTREEDARLRALHAEGLSAREIAAQLAGEGFPARSRNAVLGRGHRMGLEKREQPALQPRAVAALGAKAAQEAAQAAAVKKAVPRARARVAAAPEVAAPIVPTVPVAPAFVPPVGWRGVPFIGRTPEQCCFPLWPDHAPIPARPMVCGAPVRAGHSYCAAHYDHTHNAPSGGPLEHRAGSFARHDGVAPRGPRPAAREEDAPEIEVPDLVDAIGGAA